MAIVRRARFGNGHTIEYRDQKFTQKFTQTWNVELTNEDPDIVTDVEVTWLPGVPKPGISTYSPREGMIVPFAVCRSVSPTPDGSLRKWKVVCQFDLEGPEPQQPQQDDISPIDLMPRIEPFVESSEVTIYKDYEDKLIVDPFKKLWDQPVKAPIPLSGVRVTRYVRTYNEETLAYWLHTTNSTQWRNKPVDSWWKAWSGSL